MATPLYKPRPHRRFTWSFSLRTFFVLLTIFCGWLAYYEREHRDLRTYYFTARIVSNGGVLPFKVGTVITGHFTYDLRAKDMLPKIPDYGRYSSKRNSFVVEYGGDQFVNAVGQGVLFAGVSRSSEEVGAGAYDLKLPQGWKANRAGRSIVELMLQNAPSRGVLPNKGIPKDIELSMFVHAHEIRLDFTDGVHFLGGSVNGRATVFANLETLEPGPFENGR